MKGRFRIHINLKSWIQFGMKAMIRYMVYYTVKKGSRVSRLLDRNNSVMTSLFPPRESLEVTSQLGTGKSRTFFSRCSCPGSDIIGLLVTHLRLALQ